MTGFVVQGHIYHTTFCEIYQLGRQAQTRENCVQKLCQVISLKASMFLRINRNMRQFKSFKVNTNLKTTPITKHIHPQSIHAASIDLPLTWVAAETHIGWALPPPRALWAWCWCGGRCSCFGSAGSRTPAPPPWSAWSPRHRRCSPHLAGRNRRCQTCQTQALHHHVSFPGSPVRGTLVL